MSEERFLVVNADDLGLSTAVNDGIFLAHENGIVTGASLMVRGPAAGAAAEAVPEHPGLAIGLHLEPDDCRGQLERFRDLVGRDPTHLDSHHHVHQAEPVRAVADALAAEMAIPLRNRSIRYEGSFYGRSAISVGHLSDLIRTLPPGWTEIGCHPAAGPVPTSSYDAERQIELATLCDPRVREALDAGAVRLRSFAQAGRCS